AAQPVERQPRNERHEVRARSCAAGGSHRPIVFYEGQVLRRPEPQFGLRSIRVSVPCSAGNVEVSAAPAQSEPERCGGWAARMGLARGRSGTVTYEEWKSYADLSLTSFQTNSRTERRCLLPRRLLPRGSAHQLPEW